MSDLLKFLLKLGITVGVIAVLLIFVFRLHRVSGSSMFPSFKDGDLVITYRLDKYYTNDVVVYRGTDGKDYVGRIVANSGDTIDIQDGQLVLNGAIVSSDIMYETTAVDSGVALPYQVSETGKFIMNDYRLDTEDSRTYGEVSNDNLEGKVVFILRRRNF